jgi:ABC-type amino acid transport substrate-binding protein
MKCRLKLTILVPVLCCILFAEGRAQEYPPDIQRIVDRGKLIVVMYYKDIPPFFMHTSVTSSPSSQRRGIPSPFWEGHDFYGVDVALALHIAEALGVECEFLRTPQTFDEIIETLQRHEADIAISLLSKTLSRARKVLFTQPYVVLHHGLLLNRLAMTGHRTGASLLDLLNRPGIRIGVKGGTSWVAFVHSIFPQATIQEYPTWDPDVIDAVRKGEVMAAYADEIEIKKVIIAKPDIAIELQTFIIKDIQDPIAISVPWDSRHFLAWLNMFLEQGYHSMTTDEILEAYSESLKGMAEKEIPEEND